ncbi:diaminopimelate epimerase [Flavobacterium sp. 20NA77.7]|uniref:Diaminopimelate epimerase n=1 Tax=Flavobacterium nakdongensis TaxID=3073563 RepID=A0ABY9RB05_9FLAO|nr:diaminopimelate epimerase [Flavobacterium sp. 20NA77.7]WMW78423.1 diaminopimelate epimerase [Flavobacterium sp. 20NA77.7]
MQVTFYKYQGTGNDFIIIDNRQLDFPKNDTKLIARLCDRRFGIGADGLMLLEQHESYDFRMIYYNADGSTSTMCGNGGRCLVAFAKKLGLVISEAHFEASDGYHYAKINGDTIALQMIDVTEIKMNDTYQFVYTGSPHHVELVTNLNDYDVKMCGAKIRYSDLYGASGSNVNFVEQENENTFKVRTYERGVEDETLSCGTGVTAVAIAMHQLRKTLSTSIDLLVPGGKLQVRFSKEGQHYKNIFLIGPAEFVFEGNIKL